MLALLPPGARAADEVIRLEGRVTAVRPDGISVSLGSAHGIRVGDEGTVADEEPLPGGNARKTNIARIRVTAVRADGADATVVAAAERIRVGQQATFLFRGPAQACVGGLRVTTAPAGATVSIDGIAVGGPSPMVVHGVPCGDREVVVKLAGHDDIRRTVTVARGRVERLTVDLVVSRAPQPCAGEVQVTTDPPGALVRVDDGAVEGQAPLTRKLSCGPHVIVASLAGRDDARQAVTVSAGTQARVDLALAARPVPVVAVAAPTDQAKVSPPAAPARTDGSAPADVVVSAFGYEGVGGLQGVLTLGLLTSQYAIEIDDHLVLGWKVRSDEATVQLAPGRRRLRVLVRNVVSRSPVVLHEGYIDVKPSVRNEARVNFLISVVTVNGDLAAFNQLSAR